MPLIEMSAKYSTPAPAPSAPPNGSDTVRNHRLRDTTASAPENPTPSRNAATLNRPATRATSTTVAAPRIHATAPTIDVATPTPTANVSPVPTIPRTTRNQRGNAITHSVYFAS
jgi:hypothetical protein